MKTWTTPQTTEIKMDAEISSYQDDSYDPLKDGPHFVQASAVAPPEISLSGAQRVLPRS